MKKNFNEWDHVAYFQKKFGSLINGRFGEDWAICYIPRKKDKDKVLIAHKLYPMIMYHWFTIHDMQSLHAHIGKILEQEASLPPVKKKEPQDEHSSGCDN